LKEGLRDEIRAQKEVTSQISLMTRIRNSKRRSKGRNEMTRNGQNKVYWDEGSGDHTIMHQLLATKALEQVYWYQAYTQIVLVTWCLS